MGTLIGILILIGIFVIPNWITNQKFNNYDMSKVDAFKMSSDKATNNLSYMQVRRNTVNGKYDKR